MSQQPIYRVIYYNQNEIHELYVRQIYQSDLYGFIEVEEYLFGERSKIIADPVEEKLQTELSGVKRSYIPMHAIVRIDEVEKEGNLKVSQIKGDKVTPFPFPGQMPHSPGSE